MQCQKYIERSNGMRKRIANAMIITLAIVCVIAPNASAAELADVPNTMVYQGRLTDDAGAAITDPVSVTFSIYTEATGGTALWASTQSVTPDGNGVFTVELGPIGDTVFVGLKGYLGIKIGADPEMTPRQPLSSVPYSFRPVNLADGSVTEAKLASNAVTTLKLAANAVTGVKLADNSVSTNKIASNAVTSSDLANMAVTTNKIADGAVTSSKIVDGGVAAADIAGNSISGNKIVDGTLTSADLASNSVTSAKIASGAVGNADLANNAVTAAKGADEPGIAFRKSLPGNNFRAIPAGSTALDSISITVPAAGYVYVIAQTDIAVDHINGTTDEVYFQVSNVRHTITYSNFGFAQVMVPRELPTQGSRYYTYPVIAQKPFKVSTAGTYEFFANCWVQSGNADSDRFFNLQMTAMYFPTAYGTVDKSNVVPNEMNGDKRTGE
jgi:hypothetical protein